MTILMETLNQMPETHKAFLGMWFVALLLGIIVAFGDEKL